MDTWMDYRSMVRYLRNSCLISPMDINSPFVMPEFRAITKEVCKLPSFFSTSLFRKIDVNSTGIVSR